MSGMGDFLALQLLWQLHGEFQVIMNNGMITGTVLHWGELGFHDYRKRSLLF